MLIDTMNLTYLQFLNGIARLFDKEFDRAAQLDFVLFLDGNEKKEKAFRADVSEFRTSWQRPKWHIVVQDTMLDASGATDTE